MLSNETVCINLNSWLSCDGQLLVLVQAGSRRAKRLHEPDVLSEKSLPLRVPAEKVGVFEEVDRVPGLQHRSVTDLFIPLLTGGRTLRRPPEAPLSPTPGFASPPASPVEGSLLRGAPGGPCRAR